MSPTRAICLTVFFAFLEAISNAQIVPLGNSGFVASAGLKTIADASAKPFDLQGRSIQFTPLDSGGYQSVSFNQAPLVQTNSPLDDVSAVGPFYARSWNVALPFRFPFAGKTWDHVWVNLNGNISFEKPEGEYWPARDPWADGGMCSVAAILDERSAAGLEQMIAALWGPCDSSSDVSRIRVGVTQNCLAVTWTLTRVAFGQVVAGPSTFQARLFASGVIELAYPSIADQDGIVGLFTGNLPREPRLSQWKPPTTANPADVQSAVVYDAGSLLDLCFTMRSPVPDHLDSGNADFHCNITHHGRQDPVSVTIGNFPLGSCWLGASPRTCAWTIAGNKVHLFVSKVLLQGCSSIAIDWSISTNAGNVDSGSHAPAVNLSAAQPGEANFAAANETRQGNFFETFHYPLVTRISEQFLKQIYQLTPARDDIAIIFTDDRIDDLYGQGGGAIAANFPLKGIGHFNETPRSTEWLGSKQLQMSVATVWIGAPIFGETGVESDGQRWWNYAHGVKWVAHECTHRWGLDLSFVNPLTGKQEKLTDTVGHWRPELNTTAMYPIGSQYVGYAAPGYSVMGGDAWRENGDGTFTKSGFAFEAPGGYSPLDLYILGMLPPQRVPDTFLIENLTDLGGNRYRGTKVPVRISDVIAAMGDRQPASAQAQHTFAMTFYIIHDPNRPVNPETAVHAERLAEGVANYFYRATGGVMRVVPATGRR